MASHTLLCGICNSQSVNKESVIWCSDCDEGLCTDCRKYHDLSKGTRHHTSIPISEYQKLPHNILQISIFCPDHGEKYQTFCKKDDTPCCRQCVIQSHNKCIDLVVIDDVTRNVKSSHAFLEMTEVLMVLAENIEKIYKDKESNLVTIYQQRQIIAKEMQEIRLKINSHLDKIHAELLKELEVIEEKERNKMNKMVKSLKENLDEIKTYQTNLEKIKQHASDLQTFLSMKQMQSDIADKEKFTESIARSDEIAQTIISCDIDETLQTFSNKVISFGSIRLKTMPSELRITKRKAKEAQMPITEMTTKSLDQLSLQLEKTLNININGVRSCSMLPDGRIVFCGIDKSQVINTDGSVDFNMKVGPGAFDIANTKEDNVVAVTSGNNKTIQLFDIEKRQIIKTFDVDQGDYGITVRDNTLLYCVEGKGIKQINLIDESRGDVVKCKMSYASYIATFKDNIYFTNRDNHTLTCCDLQGTRKWEFSDTSVLVTPSGICVDNFGNLFVTGYNSHNVVVISNDGQHNKEVLSSKDGMNFPQALHYERSSNKLLVANYINTKAFIFNIK